MANISIREAAKIFDVSRPTLMNALKTGKITGSKNGQGSWEIDPAELARVYKARSTHPVKDDRQGGNDLSNADTHLGGEVQALRERLEEAERRAADLEKRAAVAEALSEERARYLEESARHIEDLRRMLPPPAPITTPPPAEAPTTPAPRRWWPWRS